MKPLKHCIWNPEIAPIVFDVGVCVWNRVVIRVHNQLWDQVRNQVMYHVKASMYSRPNKEF